MAPQLIVSDANHQEQIIPVEARVLRIGSSATCEIQLSGIAEHAATLRFAPEGYSIINRNCQRLRLGENIVPIGAKSLWHDQDVVTLDDYSLCLDLTAEHAPRRKKPEVFDIEDADAAMGPQLAAADNRALRPEPEAHGRTSSTSKTWMQLFVIVGCVLGALLILVASPDPNSGGRPQNAKSANVAFKELVDKANTSSKIEDRAERRRILGLLQEARLREARGDTDQAASLYRKVRDSLVADIYGRTADKYQQSAYDFAVERVEHYQTLLAPQ